MPLKIDVPKDVDLEKLDTLSFSTAEQYLHCGEQVYRVKILKQPTKPSFATDEGTGHHKAVSENNKSKRDKGKTLKVARMVDLCAHEVETLVKKAKEVVNPDEYFLGEKLDDAVSRAKVFYPEYMRRFDPDIEPDWVEQPFFKEITVEGLTLKLSGQIDLTTRKKKLRDYKATSSVRSQGEVDSSLQLSLYAATTGYTDVGYINFVKVKNPYVAEITSKRSPAQMHWATLVAGRVLQAMRKGVFPLADPSPQNWRCSAKFCGFWKDCRGKYEAVSQLKIKE